MSEHEHDGKHEIDAEAEEAILAAGCFVCGSDELDYCAPCYEEVYAAASNVVDHWAEGDLAAAVRELASVLKDHRDQGDKREEALGALP